MFDSIKQNNIQQIIRQINKFCIKVIKRQFINKFQLYNMRQISEFVTLNTLFNKNNYQKQKNLRYKQNKSIHHSHNNHNLKNQDYNFLTKNQNQSDLNYSDDESSTQNLEGWTHQEDFVSHPNILYNLSSNIKTYENNQKKIQEKNNLNEYKKRSRYRLDQNSNKSSCRLVKNYKIGRKLKNEFDPTQMKSLKFMKNQNTSKQLTTHPIYSYEKKQKNVSQNKLGIKKWDNNQLKKSSSHLQIRSRNYTTQTTDNNIKNLIIISQKSDQSRIINNNPERTLHQKQIKYFTQQDQRKKQINSSQINLYRNIAFEQKSALKRKQQIQSKINFFIKKVGAKANQLFRKNTDQNQFQKTNLFIFR